jgi:hypothetical protein
MDFIKRNKKIHLKRQELRLSELSEITWSYARSGGVLDQLVTLVIYDTWELVIIVNYERNVMYEVNYIIGQ